MTPKLLASAGLLLLSAAIAPVVLGHDERPVAPGVHTIPLSLGTNDDGVSGRYIGAAGPAVAIEAYTNPNDSLALIGHGFCDLEVVTDGNVPENEQTIDGFGPANGNAGSQPDSVDDGGFGRACHTTNHYSTAVFNTPGCQSGQDARGQNHAGGDIWIAAACDWKTEVGGFTSDDRLVLCLATGAVLLDPFAPPVPLGAVNQALGLLGCALDFVDCVFDPTCGPTGAIEICGAGGIPAALDFGYGSASFGAVATFPGLPANSCAAADSAATIYVFDAVTTNGGTFVDPDGAGPLPAAWIPNANSSVEIYPAQNGELWTDF